MMVGLDNIAYLDSIADPNIRYRLIDWLNDRDDVIGFTNYNHPETGSDPVTGLPLTLNCVCNRKHEEWFDVDDKTKYRAVHSIYYDHIKTSANYEINAYAKVLGQWAPAATNIRAGIHISHKKSSDCSEKTSQWTGENNYWGKGAVRQINFWNNQRSIEKPTLNSTNSSPEDGFWGANRVKHLSTMTWTKLVMP